MPSVSVELIPSIPNEVLEEIFLRIDVRSLLKCCTVCLLWSNIIQRTEFWKRKLSYSSTPQQRIPPSIFMNTSLSCKFFASVCLKNGYSKNLIVNGCGEEVSEEELKKQDSRKLVDGFTEPWPEYPGWCILSSGGSGWRVEKHPEGLDRFPEELEEKSCFCTSYHSCTKDQLLCLKYCGILDDIMDMHQPYITIKDYYSKSEAYGAVYEIHACLLDGCGNVIGKSFSLRDDMADGDGTHWRRVEHVFSGYGVGVRYVKFYHGGTDTAMKEGWFGAKITGSAVVVEYPANVVSQQTFQCECKTKHGAFLDEWID